LLRVKTFADSARRSCTSASQALPADIARSAVPQLENVDLAAGSTT